MLGQKLQELYKQLWNAIRDDEDITDLLKGMSKDDFLSVLSEREQYDDNSVNRTLFGFVLFSTDNPKCFKAILNKAKKEGVLKEIVTGEIAQREGSVEEYYSLIDIIASPQCETPSKILNEIKESCGLEAFWKVIDENDRENIKSKLKNEDRDSVLPEDQDMLNEIYQIEKNMAIGRAMKVGSALSIVTALAVGGGCFAAGVALPILALIGIAVAAAVLTGLIAGGITYVASNKLEGANVQREHDLSSKRKVEV